MMQDLAVGNPGRGVEISEFESLVISIRRMFGSSVELCRNTENRVREEFWLQLETKDRAIADYQEQVTALKEEKKNPCRSCNQSQGFAGRS